MHTGLYAFRWNRLRHVHDSGWGISEWGTSHLLRLPAAPAEYWARLVLQRRRSAQCWSSQAALCSQRHAQRPAFVTTNQVYTARSRLDTFSKQGGGPLLSSQILSEPYDISSNDGIQAVVSPSCEFYWSQHLKLEWRYSSPLWFTLPLTTQPSAAQLSKRLNMYVQSHYF